VRASDSSPSSPATSILSGKEPAHREKGREGPGRLDGRHAAKGWPPCADGSKAHLSAEPDIGIVTSARLKPANHPDRPVGVEPMGDEPDELGIIADLDYGSGDVRTALRGRHHRLVIKPLPSRPVVTRRVRPRRLSRRPRLIFSAMASRSWSVLATSLTSPATSSFRALGSDHGGVPLTV
jgi:hypothetical protein